MTRASSYRADDAVGNAMIRGTRQRSLSFFGHHLRCICLSFVFLLAAASSHVAPTQTAPDDVNTSPWSWSSVGMRTLGWFEKPFRPKTSICTPCRGYCPTRDICKCATTPHEELVTTSLHKKPKQFTCLNPNPLFLQGRVKLPDISEEDALDSVCLDAEELHFLDDPSRVVSPIPRNVSDSEKLAALMKLVRQSEYVLSVIVGDLQRRIGIYGKWGTKQPEKILEKAARPDIKHFKPWHSVEHIRDALRFKLRMESIAVLPQVLRVLQDWGARLVKLDFDKFVCSKSFGWRPVSMDVRLPNGLIVELYTPVADMDLKAVKQPNHKIYEKWRNMPLSAIRGASVAYQNAAWISQKRYTEALWRWLRKQGYASFAHLRREFLRVANKLAKCSLRACTPQFERDLLAFAAAAAADSASVSVSASASVSGAGRDADSGTDGPFAAAAAAAGPSTQSQQQQQSSASPAESDAAAAAELDLIAGRICLG